MTKLKDEFTRKEFKDCCGGGCKKCELAQAYIAEYGSRKEGLEKLNLDIKAAKTGGKTKGKKGAGKKAKGKKKAKA